VIWETDVDTPTTQLSLITMWTLPRREDVNVCHSLNVLNGLVYTLCFVCR